MEQALKERLPGNEIKVTAHVPSRQTTAEMAASLPKFLADDQPALVVWQAGTVDALRGVEPEDFRTSLDQGIDAITAAGADADPDEHAIQPAHRIHAQRYRLMRTSCAGSPNSAAFRCSID